MYQLTELLNILKRSHSDSSEIRNIIHKIATRPLPIPSKEELQPTADKIIEYIEHQLKTVPIYSSIMRNTQKKHYKSSIPIETLKLKNVKDDEIKIDIFWAYTSEDMKGFLEEISDEYKKIYIFIRSDIPKIEAFKDLRKHIIVSLEHEITHALDILSLSDEYLSLDGKQDFIAYVNDSGEIKAFIRTLYSEIQEEVRERIDNGGSLGSAIMHALSTNLDWKQIKKYVSDKNKAVLLKGLVTAFQDEGLM